MLDNVEIHPVAKNIAQYHHEKWDGSGYTAGLKGEEISLFAGIVTVADHYFSSIEKRPYRPSLTKKKAFCGYFLPMSSSIGPMKVFIFRERTDLNPALSMDSATCPWFVPTSCPIKAIDNRLSTMDSGFVRSCV